MHISKYVSWKVYMQLSKNKGMYDVCRLLCKYIDIHILKYQLCKYEGIEIFMYKRIKVYKCARMQVCKYLSV